MQLSKFLLLCFVLLVGACENRDVPKTGSKESDAKIVTQETVRMSQASPAFIASQPFEMGGLCNMETLNGKIWGVQPQTVSAANTIFIGGWGVNEKDKSAPKQIFIRLQDSKDRVFYAETKSMPREDLSKHFNEEYYKHSGYSVQIDLSNLPPDNYRAMIVMNINGKSILCASGRTLVIKGG